MSDLGQSTAFKRGHTAIVISGGGARGAYQVGALRGLLEQGFLPPDGGGIDIFVGSSAGALNAAALAAYAGDLVQGVVALERVWGEIEPQQVFRTDLRSLGRTGFQWAWDLSLGGALGNVQPKSLLDTAPLRQLLEQRIPLARLDANIENGSLHALTVTATDLHTANSVVFMHGRPNIPLWDRARCVVERTRIGVDHLMASSAIPIFFPSVEIDGRYFGDGCIRNTAPLGPAISMGVDRIIAIGVVEAGPPPSSAPPARRSRPTIAQIAGVLLDAVMLDSIEVDVEHSRRVTTGLHHCTTRDPACPFRPVEVLWLSPRRSLGALAEEHADKIPPIVRYLMRGLGSEAANTELASYLLFDATYCNRLMVQAREDVAAGRATIEKFFSGTSHMAPATHRVPQLAV